MVTNNLTNLRFKYFVDIKRCDCFFGSARDTRTGKINCFLIFNHQGPIYKRNALQDNWEKVNSAYDSNHIRNLVNDAISSSVPTYNSDNRSILN